MHQIDRIEEKLDALVALVAAMAERPELAQTSFDEGPEFLDTLGTAQFLGVSKQSIALWRSKGEGPPFSKVGGTVRYSRQALRDWMKQNEK